MAELEARYGGKQSGSKLTWRHVLPLDREVSIGRIGLTQADVPIENRAEWVTDPSDTFVSGCHAYVRWDGTSLHVRIRSLPRKPQNPIYFQREPKDSFVVAPGQRFTIGSTSFTLVTLETDTGPERLVPASPLLTQHTLGVNDLRRISFHDTSHMLKALAAFPELVRYARDEASCDEYLLTLVMESLRNVDVAAIVHLDDRQADARAVVQLLKDKRPHRSEADEFSPSNTLCRRALLDIEPTLHVRGQSTHAHLKDPTLDPAMEWAICTPLALHGSIRLGLYVAGHLPASVRVLRGEVPPELNDYLKVVALAAQIYESVYELRKAEKQINRYQGFLSRNVITLLNASNAEEMLKPRETDVTVLFCDIRGASKLAERAADDLLGNWARMSAALDVMTTAITDEGGVVGDLQGDAAMGFWGWPLPQPREVQTKRAARAALRIQRDFLKLRTSSEPYSCGVGLAHGKAVAGKLGTSDQIKLDVFGPVVNLASRLEGMTKHFGVSIVVDDSVAAGIADCDPENVDFQTRPLARVQPAGMTVAIAIHELAVAGSYSERERVLWEAAVQLFASGRFAAARSRIHEFVRMKFGQPDKPAELLLANMADREDRNPAEWNGVIHFDQK